AARGAHGRLPPRRRRTEAETAPPPPRTAVSGHAPSLDWVAVRATCGKSPSGAGSGALEPGPAANQRARKAEDVSTSRRMSGYGAALAVWTSPLYGGRAMAEDRSDDHCDLLMPILVAGYGRVGSTALMALLG